MKLFFRTRINVRFRGNITEHFEQSTWPVAARETGSPAPGPIKPVDITARVKSRWPVINSARSGEVGAVPNKRCSPDPKMCDDMPLLAQH
jgi:hypothetical protein